MAGNYEHFDSAGTSVRQGSLDWQADALCAQTNPELFVLDKGGSSVEARRICANCDVGLQCLHFALENARNDTTLNDKGIYGGMSAQERKKLINAAEAEVARAYAAKDAVNKKL